jgi:hypothetical protein
MLSYKQVKFSPTATWTGPVRTGNYDVGFPVPLCVQSLPADDEIKLSIQVPEAALAK